MNNFDHQIQRFNHDTGIGVTPRNSSIELLKIFAMLLIVISHVTQTLTSANPHFSSNFVIDIIHATSNPQYFFIAWMRIFGSIGNALFFICSAWFLLDSNNIKRHKIALMILNVWIISIIFLITFKTGNWFDIGIKDSVRSMFPTIFANNWYITCYIMFYAIHPALNQIIYSLTKKQLLSIDIVLFVMYCLLNFIDSNLFFISYIIEFIVEYFLFAYAKLYLPRMIENIRVNVVITLIGILGAFVLMLITNLLGLRMSLFSNQLSRWTTNLSPFVLMVAFGVFNLVRSKHFVGSVINMCASLTLYVYILHDNILVRTYLRPQVWVDLHRQFGYAHVILIDFGYSLCLFFISFFVAFLYQTLLHKPLDRISRVLEECLFRGYDRVLEVLLKIE